jgi:hypothetical protein
LTELPSTTVAPQPDHQEGKGKYQPGIRTLALPHMVRVAQRTVHFAVPFSGGSMPTVFNKRPVSSQNSMTSFAAHKIAQPPS